MTTAEDLSDLEAVTGDTLRQAFERGREVGKREAYQLGYAEAIAKVLASAQNLQPNTAAVATDAKSEESPQEEFKAEWGLPPPSRAPRGALDPLLDSILSERPGQTTQEIEAAVSSADPRIAIKSVYNRLRFFEKGGRKFRRQAGLWYRIGDIPGPFPVIPSSPQGETGAGGPGLINAADKGGQSLMATGGGT